MKNDDFKLLRVFFADRWTDEQTEKWTGICDVRLAFATEKEHKKKRNFKTYSNFVA